MTPIIKWEPMWPLEDIEKFFSDFSRGEVKGFSPAVDVYETKNSVVVETPLAGMDPKDVDISIENDVLTIKGESKKESEVDDKNYYRKEIRSGSFYRSVALPAHVIGEKAKAESHEGMLKITIPKEHSVKPKSIKVKTVKKKK